MSALDTFKRAMRRHERRAKRAGLGGIAWALRTDRIRLARGMTPICDVRSHTGAGASYRRTRFLYSLAADAVARLRVGLACEAEQAEVEADAAPFVCHGCLAVAARCASWCPDLAMERAAEEREQDGCPCEGDDDDMDDIDSAYCARDGAF